MKDLPHHIQKLNRRIIRSEHREEIENEAFFVETPRKQTPAQVKKQAKAKLTKTRNARTPTPLTPEERNKKMKARVPVFERLKKPKVMKKTRKKTPRI